MAHIKFDIPEMAKQREVAESGLLSKKSEEDIPNSGLSVQKVPDGSNSFPVSFARSSLFGLVMKGSRKYLRRATVAAWKNWQVKFTGEQLSQSDLDILLTVAHMTEATPSGIVRTSFCELLRFSGRKNCGKSDIEWLKNTLSRLTACDLNVRYKHRYNYHGNLLNWAEDEHTGEIFLWLNESQKWIWESVAWISLSLRSKLKMDLSKWLHGYVSTHETTENKPHFIKVGNLYNLCGSKTAQGFKFRQQLRKAMGELEAVGIIAEWSICKDILEIYKAAPSISLKNSYSN